MIKCIKIAALFSMLLVGFFVLLSSPTPLRADAVSDLQAKIKARNEQIAALEKDIAEFQKQLDATGKQSKTLQNSIAQLEITRKKLLADLQLTQNKIYAAQLQITSLGNTIEGKEKDINKNTSAVAEILRNLQNTESYSLPEMVLSGENFSEIWNRADDLGKLQNDVREHIDELKKLKEDLTASKKATEATKQQLTVFQDQLGDKKTLVEQNKKETASLLTQTKKQEQTYKEILAQKEAQKKAFERDLLDFESQLKFNLDPSRLPSTGTGVLLWPLDKVRITQYFGMTDFAKANAAVYNGKGHNAIDLAAAQGTPVKAALSGTIQGVGNTDEYPGCYSYGKWVLIKHNNGLSTLYAHLSLIKVSVGQTVTTSEVIGYSGATGYATGPHLHFSVYASQGVEIVKLGSVRSTSNCKNAAIPVASLNAYLNPLLYL